MFSTCELQEVRKARIVLFGATVLVWTMFVVFCWWVNSNKKEPKKGMVFLRLFCLMHE